MRATTTRHHTEREPATTARNARLSMNSGRRGSGPDSGARCSGLVPVIPDAHYDDYAISSSESARRDESPWIFHQEETIAMFIAMNRFKVKKGLEEEFEISTHRTCRAIRHGFQFLVQCSSDWT